MSAIKDVAFYVGEIVESNLDNFIEVECKYIATMEKTPNEEAIKKAVINSEVFNKVLEEINCTNEIIRGYLFYHWFLYVKELMK